MSKEQISDFIAAVKADAAKLKGAADLDSAVALAKEAGFDVNKADWLRFQAEKPLELSDEDLEKVAGGAFTKTDGSQARDGCDAKTVFC